ncbi:MAG: tetratricopeptide repeat protein [Treponema sp.]|jgi:tetratricopeptide (TPR) repeat protein|nr:tetratricopeptide repeat protein [Treponema sp.]
MKYGFFQTACVFCLLGVFSACGGKPAPLTLAPRSAEGLSLPPAGDAAFGPEDFLSLYGAGPAYSAPSGDGGIVLFDAVSKRELFRFYGFDTGEWLGIVPEGYYSASPNGASLFTVKAGGESYTLNQFSEALRRPDLLAKSLAGKGGASGAAFAGLLKKNAPPQVSFRISPDLRTVEGGPVLEVKVSAEKGGAGMLALYRRGGTGREIPAGLFDIAETALREYREDGKTCYDLVVYTPAEEGDSAFGVSAFNRAMTVESARSWAEFAPATPLGDRQAAAGAPAAPKPSLYLLFADAGNGPRQPAAGESLSSAPAPSVEEILLRQKAGALYSDVKIFRLSGAEFNKTGFSRIFEDLRSKINPADVFVLCLRGRAGADERGDLYFANVTGKNRQGKNGKEGVGKQEIAANLLRLKTRNTLLLLEAGDGGPEDSAPAGVFGVSAQGAFDRLLERLGPRALIAAPASGISAVLSAVVRAAEDGAPGGSAARFISAADLASRAGSAAAGPWFRVSSPDRDFLLIDRFLEQGELRVSVLFPGTVTITGAGGTAAEGRYLDSLEGMNLKLPEGNYAVSITYRNSYRETRGVELRNNGFTDVSFTYRPRLGMGDFRTPPPAFGVNFAELNPSEFRNIDQDLLRQMGMEQYRVSFLAGEKFYRNGEYDRAIAEYDKSLNLKADYAEAYIGRGNAYRKKGDSGRAIDDYSRALRFKPDLPELYNYRGYAYAEHGDAAKAIEDYSRALQLKNDYADACFNRAYVFARQGDYDRAIDDYTRVLKLEPRNAAALNQRGNAWYRKEDDDRAIRDYSEAIKIRPDYALAWHNRGNAWFNKGDYDKALADLDQAIRLQPDSPNAYASRGSILQKMGDPASVLSKPINKNNQDPRR